MLSQRNTHYWLWFLLFGVVSALVTGVARVKGITTETMWLLIAGFVGLVLGTFLPSLARPFDLVIGLLFTAVGLLGILHAFGLNLVAVRACAPNAIDETAILGLEPEPAVCADSHRAGADLAQPWPAGACRDQPGRRSHASAWWSSRQGAAPAIGWWMKDIHLRGAWMRSHEVSVKALTGKDSLTC